MLAASRCEDFKKNQHFKKCERNKIYLSQDLRTEIDDMIVNFSNNNKIINLENTLKQLFNEKKFFQLAELYNKSLTNPQNDFNQIIRKFIDCSYNMMRIEFHETLKEENMDTILKKFRDINFFLENFVNFFSNKEIIDAMNHYFMNKAEFFMEQINQKMRFPNEQSNLVNTYNMLFKLYELKVIGFEGTMALVNEEIFNYMMHYNHAFAAGLKEKDFERIKNAMNSVLAVDSIWSRHNQVDKLMSYEQMKIKLKQLIESVKNDFMGADGSFIFTSDSSSLEKEYDAYFENLENKHNLLNKFKAHFKDMFPEVELGMADQDFNRLLDQKMRETLGRADEILARMLNGKNTSSDLRDFNVFVYNLKSYEKLKRRRVAGDHKPVLEYFQDKIMDHIAQITQRAKLDETEKAADCFVSIKKISKNLVLFKDTIDTELERVMQAHIKQVGFKKFGELAIKLRESTEGQMIVHEHTCFEGYQRSVFNNKTIQQDINYVLNLISGDNLDQEVLKENYKEFHELYESLVVQHLSENNLEENQDRLESLTKNLAEDMGTRWDKTVKAKIPKLLAHMFALWTVMNSRGFFETTECDMRSYLFKPHPAQVISVFRMLGIGYTGKESFLSRCTGKVKTIESNLVQLGTGEGKSITLGITCALLSLLGFDVQCVCYSQYLSDRDFKALKPIFERLGVEKFIEYGTFKQICESFINNNGDVRKTVETFLKNDTIQRSSKVSGDHRPKILLIDEVDVFFSEDFYGSSYNPALALQSRAIEALARDLWKQRQSINYLSSVERFDSYQQCCAEFLGWKKPLLDHFVKSMIRSLKGFEQHKYIVKDDKIGYTEHDGIEFNTTYGYLTMFAYFKENERGKISDQSLKANIRMNINVGKYSFAEIPKSFEAIIGLSGTLDSLTESQKNIVKNEYGIKLMTFIPSVYGDKKLLFDKSDKRDIVIEKKESYHKELVQHIRYRQSKYGPACKRPILIFFEDKEKLMELYNSDEYMEFKNDTAYLIEEASPEEKTHIVMNATSEGKKLLATRIFGRGTDFVVYDTKVRSNGGVHVIQTFLSEELSEEIQIKGRTARQGDEGSYSMFLLDSSLEKFKITAESLAQNESRLYDHLHEKRNEYFSNKYSESIKNVDKIKNRHSQSMDFLNDLKAKNYQEVQKFIIDSMIY